MLLVGATNFPQQLDDAALRRMPLRLLVPLPDLPARVALMRGRLRSSALKLDAKALEGVAARCEGYSGSDLASLCKEAAMG